MPAAAFLPHKSDGMSSMWTKFGFADTPYRVTPLSPTDDDYKLFTTRARDESHAFLTAMDSKDGSVVIISGDIGIGKTTFVNAHQLMLATERGGWGRKLLPCVRPTDLRQEDSPTSLAHRIVHNAVDSIASYCSQVGKSLPKECRDIQDWLSHRESTTGYQIVLGLVGFGRNVSLPPVGNAILETWRDVLEALSKDVRSKVGVDGFVVCLDNAETLTQLNLSTLLMAYRDSLFVIPGIWWVVIGQSELYKQIESNDPRISERVTDGIELSHLTVEEFQDLIDKRVRLCRSKSDAVSPLSKNVHDRLFGASCGEIRFVLATAEKLFIRMVTIVRQMASKDLPADASPSVREKRLDQAITELLVERQIPDELAFKILEAETRDRIDTLHKFPGMVETLQKISTGSVRSSDYESFGFESADKFAKEILEPLRNQGLLGRRPERDGHSYYLKGFAFLAREFNLLK